MRRFITQAIPVFVAATAFVLSSTPLAAQQEHNHGNGTAAEHSCACCGNSSGTAMNHAAGGCCGSMGSSQAAAQDHSAHQTPPAEKAEATPMFQSMAGCSADGAAKPTAAAGGGGCCGSMAMGKATGGPAPMAMGDAAMPNDMAVFRYLLDNRADIRRTVTVLPNGIDTLTESDKPEIAAQLKTHVAAMYARLKDGKRIHQRDPLFVELFEHADQIDANISYTEKGLRVVETSSDPAVAVLLQKHAEAVNGFLKNGRPEMMKDHLD